MTFVYLNFSLIKQHQIYDLLRKGITLGVNFYLICNLGSFILSVITELIFVYVLAPIPNQPNLDLTSQT